MLLVLLTGGGLGAAVFAFVTGLLARNLYFQSGTLGI